MITAKDLQNLKTSKRADDAQELLEFISELREKENARVVVTADENCELQILRVQTKEMQRMFDGYPEVLLLDATYRTNKHKMPLFVFMVEDGAGCSHVVAYAFVASEQQHIVTKLLQTFVTNNPKASETSVVMVDKDFTEIGAIKNPFNHSLPYSCANFMS